MIKDYKGEMPKNVTTPDKAKAKKPFYKDWKFWVLTGLMTLFGACSIYGLVLGSQYVKAIERASHIIADAQSGSVAESDGLKKNRQGAVIAGVDDVACVDLGSLSWVLASTSRAYTRLDNNIVTTDGTTLGNYVCSSFTQVTYANLNTYPDNYDEVFAVRLINSNVYFQVKSTSLITSDITSTAQIKEALSGLFFYYRMADPSSGTTAKETFYDEGYQDGYQEGFDDGADSQANEQTIKVLLAPDFTGDRVQYTYTLDGAEVGTGYLSNTNQHYQNQVQFSRPAGGQHKAVLNLYSDNDEPIKIAYDTFTGTLGETRYLWYMKSNAYDWSTSQWYVPTYWAEARFLVTGYGTYDQGFTEDYFFNLDPQYNDRAKVGAYSEGYDAGYNDAVESGDAFDAGYEQGYDDGERQGETDGFNRGVAVGSSGSQSLALMFKTAFQLPFDQLYRFLNFNLLGINFLSLFTALISVSIGIMVIKKVL